MPWAAWPGRWPPERPRSAGELKEALKGHLHQDPPEFTPDLRVPADFDRWVRWLLTKPVEKRVSRAAEAADTLAALGGHPRESWRAGWRRPVDKSERPLHGVGLGLLGVRSVPLVGREKEQDLLWEQLLQVDREGTPRAVVLDGAAGFGKTRLAMWLAEWAHELGAAEVLSAHWSPAGGAALTDMLSRDLACDGLQRPEVQIRVKTVLRRLEESGSDERAALTELLSPLDLSDPDAMSNPRRRAVPENDRRRLLLNHLQRRSRRRPLVLVLDDVQWGFDGLQLVQALLADPASQRMPVLVLCTVENEALTEQPATRMEVRKLLEHPRVSKIRVAPLRRRDHEQLVEGLLGLEAGLASRVQRRTVGNPGFTLELVADWVQKGLLELTAGGYRLKSGVEAPLPLELYERWWRRLERALVDRPSQDVDALELAAILGVVVMPQEWRDVARAVDLRAPPSLIKHLIEQKIVVAKDGDASKPWSFSQPMLRATLERRAQEQGRALRWHQECARVLASGGKRSDERVGLHLLAASLPDDALPPLTRAGHRRLLAGDFPRAEEIIQSRRDALRLLAADEHERIVVEQRLLEAELARRTARLPRALAKADRAAQLVRETNAVDLLPAALHEQGSALLAQGELGESRRILTEALGTALAAGNRGMVALCHRGLAEALLRLGNTQQAVDEGRRGVTAAQVFAEPLGLAEARVRLAEALMANKELPEALERLRQARRAFQHLGARAGLAESLGLMGTLAFRQRAFERAEQCYLRAERQLDDLGATTAVMMSARRGLALTELGRLDEARDVLSATRDRADERALAVVRALANCALLPVAVGLDDRPLLSRCWNEGQPLVEATGVADLDLARAATRAAKEAQGRGWTEDSLRIAGLAIAQWEALGRGEIKDVARLRRLSKAGPASS